MTNAITQTAPVGPEDIESPVSRRSLVARRRRILFLVVLLVLAAVALAANYGPVQSYVDARSRLDKVTAKVGALEEQKAELQSRLGKLTEAEYLETLAREELTYARPGEDLYIVTGAAEEGVPAEPGATTEDIAATGAQDDAGTGDDTSAAREAANAADRPGPLERLLSAFLGLF